MNDRNHKLLIWLIYVISISTLLLILVLGWFVFTSKNEVRELRNAIERIERSKPVPLKGVDGKTPIKNIDYFDGQNGKDGRNGKDSVSTHTETVTIKETPAKDGKDGKDGQRGPAGPAIETMVDPVSCLFMSKYSGDESWTILAQLPKPCEVL